MNANSVRLVTPDSCTLPLTLTGTFDTMMYADIVLTCGEGSQHPVSHKSVLASASEFLKELLESNPESHELIIPDISSDTMVQILSLIYTGEVIVQNQGDISLIIQGIELLQIHVVKQIDIVRGVTEGVQEGQVKEEEYVEEQEELDEGAAMVDEDEMEYHKEDVIEEVTKLEVVQSIPMSEVIKKKKLKRVYPMVVTPEEYHTGSKQFKPQMDASDNYFVTKEVKIDEENLAANRRSTLKDHAYAHKSDSRFS